MTTYRNKDGAEIVVCDTCGIDYFGDKPDVSLLTKVDFTAEMMGLGFPDGTKLDVTDTCPDCEAAKPSGRPAAGASAGSH